MSDRDNVILQSIKKLQKAGFVGVKIELEANLDRGESHSTCEYCEEGYSPCDTCNTDWEEVECPDCEGAGNDGNEAHPCDRCDGEGILVCGDCDEGYRTCEECGGDWDSDDSSLYDEDECLRFILGELESALHRSHDNEIEEAYDHDGRYIENPFPGLEYARFYNDGSVDSELTYTVSFEKPEYIQMLPMVVEAFKALGNEIGNGIEVSGAGMHMALLTDLHYDPNESIPREHWTAWNNFQSSMQLLLPALYFLGTTNSRSRGLGYRRPMVSTDKYSAIHLAGNAVEFRVFDTCYDTPEAILDNLVVMANCMTYWTPEFKPSGLRKICSGTRFGNQTGYDLDRFYKTAQHIDLLNGGLAKLKPSYYTIKELKQQRDFSTDKRKVNKFVKEREQQAKLEYREYVERFDWKLKTREISEVGYFLENQRPPTSPEAERLLREKAEAHAKLRIEQEKLNCQPEDTYIRQAVLQFIENLQGEFTLMERN